MRVVLLIAACTALAATILALVTSALLMVAVAHVDAGAHAVNSNSGSVVQSNPGTLMP